MNATENNGIEGVRFGDPTIRRPEADSKSCNVESRTMFTGDCLDILRGFNDSCIDLIYLDPPFNSKHDYAAPVGSEAAGAGFKDTWTLDDIDRAWLGTIAEENAALYKLINATTAKSDRAYLIYMAVRVMEMERVLKETGSIYLHCDPTMSHWLKLLMDAIFGRDNFRNEIVWKRRQDTHNRATRTMGSVHDVILWYGDPEKSPYRRQFMPYDEKYVESHYKYDDGRGKYRLFPCTNETGGNARYEFRGIVRAWRFGPARMQDMYAENLLVQLTGDGPFYYKKCLSDAEGVPLQDLWVDIPPARGKERTDYPTQKPLSVLERIIATSSDEGDMVLDPFCGCATTCVSAERSRRSWIGIDISPIAYKLVRNRVKKDLGLFGIDIMHRTDIPKRTGVEEEPHYRTHKRDLFGKQEGRCAGCHEEISFEMMYVDRILSGSRGGTDRLDNLQLLCGHCSGKKGGKSQAEFMAVLERDGLAG